MLLGLVPTLGGPTQPLHWAMTAGMFGVGALLAVRHRARGQEAALEPLVASNARPAGRTLLVICGIVALIIAGIVASRVRSGGDLSWLSVAMPVVGLVWFASIGFRASRVGDRVEARRAADSASATARARVTTRSTSHSTPPPRPQVSA